MPFSPKKKGFLIFLVGNVLPDIAHRPRGQADLGGFTSVTPSRQNRMAQAVLERHDRCRTPSQRPHALRLSAGRVVDSVARSS